MSNFDGFIKLVDEHCSELASDTNSNGSTETVLLNHLQRLSSNSHASSRASDVNGSIEAVMRFATDSIDWESPLLRRVTEITEYHSALIKAEQQ